MATMPAADDVGRRDGGLDFGLADEGGGPGSAVPEHRRDGIEPAARHGQDEVRARPRDRAMGARSFTQDRHARGRKYMEGDGARHPAARARREDRHGHGGGSHQIGRGDVGGELAFASLKVVGRSAPFQRTTEAETKPPSPAPSGSWPCCLPPRSTGDEGRDRGLVGWARAEVPGRRRAPGRARAQTRPDAPVGSHETRCPRPVHALNGGPPRPTIDASRTTLRALP